MDSQDQVVLITGGAGNIGRTTALKVAELGAVVAVCDLDLTLSQKVVDDIVSRGGRGMTVKVDVQKDEEVERAVADIVSRYQRGIDILVNAAGGSARSRSRDLHEQSIEVIRENIGVNLFGAIFFARAVARTMIAGGRGGRIINVTSIIGMQGKKRHVEYAAAKGGLIAMTKSLAIELGRYDITVNCVSPGLVPRDDKDVSNTNVLARNGTAEEVADLILFLASAKASFITGQNYVIDGGRSLGLKGD